MNTVKLKKLQYLILKTDGLSLAIDWSQQTKSVNGLEYKIYKKIDPIKYTKNKTKGEKRIENILHKKHVGNAQTVCINGIPEKRRQNVKHFLKDINLQTQEAHQTSSSVNIQTTIFRHVSVKLFKLST